MLTSRRKGPRNLGGHVLREWLGVGLVAWTAVLILWLSGATNAGDNLFYDQLSRIYGRTPSDKILIVAIDDPSLQTYGAWPWSRRLHAKVIDQLTAAGAAAIAYDVLFIEPDRAESDAALAKALAKSGRTVLPLLTIAPGEDGHAVKVVRPVESLASAAARLGHVNLVVDADGVARRFSEVQAANGACWRHLTLALLDTVNRAPPDSAKCAPLAAASGRLDALIASPPRLISFAGPPGRFRTVSAASLLNGDIPAEVIKGRLVLVGATAEGLGDRHMTAVSGRNGAMPGVEIQANILDGLIQGAVIKAFPRWAVAILSLAPVSVFMAALLILKPSTNMIVGVGLFCAVFAGSALALLGGFWFPPMVAATGVLLAYPLWSWRRLAAASDYLREEISRFAPPGPSLGSSRLNDTLGRQVSALSRAADHLRDLSRLLEDALQSLPDAAVVVDQAGLVTLANSHAARLVGASAPSTLVGSSLSVWLSAAIGALESDAVLHSLTDAAGAGEITSARGVDYEVSRAPLVTADGGDAGAILRLADITAVRSAMRQREQALQFLTHDIRAPLSSIIAITQTGDPKSDDARSSKVTAYARRALALAEGYVQFARAESYRFQAEPFDFSQAVLDAADEIWPQAEAKSIKVDVQGVESDIFISGDRSLITRALINLLDNAVKYSPPKTVTTVSLRATTGQAMCIVADQGPGMSATAANQLFQVFHRGEAWRHSSTGAGLGLAVVHAVAKRHGGVVTYATAPSGGAQFEFRLPLADRPVD